MALEQGAEFDIVIKQGATYRRVFKLREEDQTTVIPLTGYTGRAQVREKPGSDNLLLTFTVTINEPLGEVTIYAADEDTALMEESGFYDVELVSAGGEVEELIYGRARLRKQVTLP